MRNYATRCQSLVYDKRKKRYHRCNNGIYKFIGDEKICWCHYNKRCFSSVLSIQKMYRGYKARRYLKIYNRLPDDIQIIIKRAISREYYERLYCKSIYRIIRQRYRIMDTILIENNLTYRELHYYEINDNDNDNDINSAKFISIFLDSIYPVYKLYNQYFNIVYNINNQDLISDIGNLHIMSYPLLDIVRIISKDYFYNYENSRIQEDAYNRLTNSIFIINSLSEQYEKYYILE